MAELLGLFAEIERIKRENPITYRQAFLEARGDKPPDGHSYWPAVREQLDYLGITVGGVMTQEAKDILTGATKRELDAMPPKPRLRELLRQNKAAIMAAMPRHMNPDRLLRVAQTACTSTPKLMDCYVPSLLGGIMQAAQFGLEPNTPMGHCFLVPYRRNLAKRGEKPQYRQDAQLIIGYRGLIDLARRSGQIVSIAAHCVRDGDFFEWEYGLDEKLRHKPAQGERGEITHAYAVAKLVGGGHAFEVLTRAEVDQVMLGTKSAGKWGPWRDRYEPMARKTAIRMLAKYIPMTVELAAAAGADSLESQLRDDGAIDTVSAGEAIFDGDGPGRPPEPAGREQLPDADTEPALPAARTGWPSRVVGPDGKPWWPADAAGNGAALDRPAYDGPSMDSVMAMIRDNVVDEPGVADVRAILRDVPEGLIGKDQCFAALNRKATELEAQ